MVEPQLVNAGRGAKARSAVASSDPEEGALPFAIPPRANLLPARLDALDGIAAALPGEGRRRSAALAQRHADRLLNPARHSGRQSPSARRQAFAADHPLPAARISFGCLY